MGETKKRMSSFKCVVEFMFNYEITAKLFKNFEYRTPYLDIQHSILDIRYSMQIYMNSIRSTKQVFVTTIVRASIDFQLSS